MIGIIYLIGCFIALLLGMRLLYKERNNDDIDSSVITPLIIMSWVSVFMILWKIRDKLIWLLLFRLYKDTYNTIIKSIFSSSGRA